MISIPVGVGLTEVGKEARDDMNAQIQQTFADIHQKGLTAAQLAAEGADAKLGPEALRGLDCGFAWVQITPGNSPFARYLKTTDMTSKHWERGIYIWGSKLHNISTQSIGVHEAAARAYAEYVRDALCKISQAPMISVGTRYD